MLFPTTILMPPRAPVQGLLLLPENARVPTLVAVLFGTLAGGDSQMRSNGSALLEEWPPAIILAEVLVY